jgi:hypothetical protein
MFEGLGFNHSYVQFPCNPRIEDYTDIFYVVDKGDIPSIQYKTSLTGPKSTRKVDDLSLILIDFYVPALTPRLSNTEPSLQLSENITLFAICRIFTGVINKETEIDPRCLGRIIYIQTVQCGGQDRTLWYPCLCSASSNSLSLYILRKDRR